MKYNLLDLNENVVLENVTLEEVEQFLANKESEEYILEELG